MKRFLIAASCLTLAAPAIAEAQYNPPQNGKPEQQVKKPSGGPQGGAPNRPGSPGGGNYQPNSKPAPTYGGPNRPGNPGGGNYQPNSKPAPNYRPAPNYSGGNGGRPNYGPNYRGAGSGQLRYGSWNGQRYRGAHWVWPRSYGYRRWWIGGILPAIFFSQAYWFDDYASLGFDAPPYGFEWVRYGPDLLLVNVTTGQIVDVEYGVFD